jgi:hypothetical protein
MADTLVSSGMAGLGFSRINLDGEGGERQGWSDRATHHTRLALWPSSASVFSH